MSRSSKRRTYLISSSESDTSNHEDKDTSIENTSPGLLSSNISKDIGKRARTSIDTQVIENDQISMGSNNSAETGDNAIANSVSTHSIEINNDSENDEREPNANDQHVSNISETLQFNTNNGQISNVQTESSSSLEEHTNTESTSTTLYATVDLNNDSLRSHTQTSIVAYFSPKNDSFQHIADLNESTTNFQIRCKVISLSSLRHFGSNKVFDAIVCDTTGEIKIVAFNEEADRLYDSMNINQKITIENGEVQLANPKYRSPYSVYEIRLCPITLIQSYECVAFNPLFKITKQELRNISEMLHGVYVDIEGVAILDRGVITTASHDTSTHVRRRSIKIKDQTATVNVTIWNEKLQEVPDNVINTNIRIRNGRTNHYNDYVSINVSSQSMIHFY